jgi:iron complex outermembrane recepter protein
MNNMGEKKMRNTYKNSVVSVLAVCIVPVVMAPSIVVAQTSVQTASERNDTVPGQPGPEERDAESVVVTGSRLARDANETAPNPVTTITRELLEQRGVTTVNDYLQQLPSAGVGASRTATLAGGSAPAEVGTNLLNLRELGIDRTLVVIDGRRHVGGVPGSGAVDVNSIPVALIQRIEVSTGGSSVAYGADAVAGAVNIVTRSNIDGIEVRANSGISTRGDGEQVDINLIAGRDIGDRGNYYVFAGYGQTGAISSKDRKWVSNQPVFVPNVEDTGPNDGRPAFVLRAPGRISAANLNGILVGPGDIANGFTGAVQFRPDGTVRPYNPGVQTGGTFNLGGDGLNLADISTIAVETDRVTLAAGGNYDLSNTTRLNFEVKYHRAGVTAPGQPTSDTFTYRESGELFLIQPDNPYIRFDDPALSNFYNERGGFVLLSRVHQDLGVRTTESNRQTWRTVLALSGDLPSLDVDYDIFYQFSETSERRIDRNSRDPRSFRLATDAVTDVTGVLGRAGAPACRATLDAALGGTRGADPLVDACRPLNIYGVGLADPAAVAYVRRDFRVDRSQALHNVGANIRGNLFELPAGSIGYAAGLEWRRESSRSDPEAAYLVGATFDGTQLPVRGNYSVFEGYMEAAAPLLRDQPGFQLLQIEGGVRVSRYSTVGSTVSWRGGAVWEPVDGFKLRGTVSRAVRAPNIGELFTPVQQAFSGFDDPCDAANINAGPAPATRRANCTADLARLGLVAGSFTDPSAGVSKTIVSGGNTKLREESADTFTIGMTFKPVAIPNLTLSADFYRVDVDDAISAPSVQQIVDDCYDRAPNLSSAFCGLFSRSANGFSVGTLQNVVSTNRNISKLETQGVDMSVRYSFELPSVGGTSLGDFRIGLVSTYLNRLRSIGSPGAAADNSAGEIGAPRWRTNLDFDWQRGAVSLSGQFRYLSSAVSDVEESAETRSPFKSDATVITDLQLGWTIRSSATLLIGASNIFDVEPPVLSRTGRTTAGSSALYDPIGSYVYAAVRLTF